jgi:HK97 family phage major capsid protein
LSTSQELREQRASLAASARQLLDKVEEEKRDALSEEERDLYDSKMQDIDKLAKDIEKCERQEHLQQVEAELRQSAGRKVGPAPIKNQSSNQEYAEALRTWCLAGSPSKRTDSDSLYRAAQLGFDCHSNGVNLRSLSVGTPSAGGYTVPITLTAGIEEKLQYYFPVSQYVNTFHTSAGEDLDFTLSDDVAQRASIKGEAVANGTATDPALDRVTMGAFKYVSGHIKVSWELLEDSSINIVDYLSNAFGARFGRTFEEAVISSNAGSTAPEGLLYGVSAGATMATGNNIDVAKLIDTEVSLDLAYRRNPSVAWVMHDSTWGAIRQISTEDSLPLIQTDLQNAFAPRLLGYPVHLSSSMLSYSSRNSPYQTNKPLIYFGCLNKYSWRTVGTDFFQRLDELYSADGQIGFNMVKRVDGRYTHVKACAKTLNTFAG